MTLDPQLCQSARRARDPRFDGRFFVAVRTTRIYCRPVCPAPAAKEANVVYYLTAAAAEAAGFRPCLRCRPAAVQPPAIRPPIAPLPPTQRPPADSPLLLPVRQPYDWPSLLAFLRARAIPGLEEVDDHRYTRHCDDVTITVRYTAPHLLLHIEGATPHPSPDLLRRTRRLFDADADPLPIREALRTDPLLAPLLAARPGLRVPGAWDPFEIGIRAILGQQISVAGARTLAGRLLASFRKMPTPEQLADADLSSIGLPAARQQTLRAYARAVLDGNERLEGIRGIGPWTRAYYAMRALADPDAFPAGDLVLRKAAHCTEKQLAQRAEAWRPWRAYAAVHLWRSQA
ncbi:MAG: AlkA N-terminal domain-containing protein [Acidobacteriota bacterium]